MYKSILLLLLFFLTAEASAGFFSAPDSYQACVLDVLPDSPNDVVAVERVVQCRKAFPGYTPPPENPVTLFGPATRSECILDYAKTTPSSFAATQIREACFFLFSQ